MSTRFLKKIVRKSYEKVIFWFLSNKNATETAKIRFNLSTFVMLYRKILLFPEKYFCVKNTENHQKQEKTMKNNERIALVRTMEARSAITAEESHSGHWAKKSVSRPQEQFKE